MAATEWAKLIRKNQPNIVVRKSAVSAFSSVDEDDEQTFVWLVGSSNAIRVDEREEDVARAIGAA